MARLNELIEGAVARFPELDEEQVREVVPTAVEAAKRAVGRGGNLNDAAAIAAIVTLRAVARVRT